jgi:hypothetical protein
LWGNANDAERDFREWALLLPEELLVSFAVYADETGTHDPSGKEPGSAVAGVCGFFSWSDEWAKLSGEWKEVLTAYDVPKFHYRQLANDPRYKAWSREKREEFLLRLATIIGKRTRFCLTAFFNVRDYDAVIPEWFKSERPNPYRLCLKLFFEAMHEELRKLLKPESQTKVAFVFDQSDSDWQESVLFFFNGTKALFPKENHMGSLRFAESSTTIPLQAADMLAYRLRKVHQTLMTSTSDASRDELDRAMCPDSSRMNLYFYSKSQLESLARNLEAQRPKIEEGRRQRALARISPGR